MSVEKLSENVSIDTTSKIIYVDMSKMTDDDKHLVEWNKQADYLVKPMPQKKKRKSSNHKKEWYLENLSGSDKEEFEKICKNSGYFAATSWYRNKFSQAE